jgi:mono/diheme cytochrome c family protein
MMRTLMLAAALAASLATGAVAQPGGVFNPREENVEDLPAGPGRDETFGLCAACHAYKLVSNQGMSRAQWDETLTFMTNRHNMPDVQGADRDLILDYLAAHHPPRTQGRGGWTNPFAPQ